MRHAEALDGADDSTRPLSPHGFKQARELARFLKSAGIEFDAAYSSPLVRARETAESVVRVCGTAAPEDVKLVDALSIEASKRDFEGWARCLPELKHVLVVGHAPTLADRVRGMVGMPNPDSLRLPKAGLVCVEAVSGRGAALKFFVTPKLLGS